MNEQPDKIFRDKLRGYQKPVRAEVWNRISSNIAERKSSSLWLKIAAAILLLAVAAVLLFTQLSQKPEQAIVENKVLSPTHDQATKNAPTSEGSTVAEDDEKPLPHSQNNPSEAKRSQKKTEEPVGKAVTGPDQTQANVEQAKGENDNIPVITYEDVDVKTVTVREQPESKSSAGQNTRVKLELNAEEINAKYLDKNAVAEATSGEKKPSTLRKLLDKAYDLKHNQDPLGDLRQKKNEIFALNFKSDKQRGENK